MIGRFLYSGYGNHCRVLKQPFHHPFSADLHLFWRLIFFFSALCTFFFFSFLGLHPLPSSLRLLEEAERAAGLFSGSTDAVSVESVRLRPVGALSLGHIYRKRASECAKAPGWSCYIPPLNSIRLSVCKSDCLSTLRRSVLSRFYYLLSHTPRLPLPAFHCLSLPSSRIVSLYLALL